MNAPDRVREYFDREAGRFDAIYESKKPLTQRVVDGLFRRVVVERFRLIRNLAPMSGPWTVLDVGCGSGRYSIALAEAGAARVVGVDASAAMIALAQSEAARLGVASRCTFETSPFTEFRTDELFDVVVATGYFDYLRDPEVHLARMVARCRGRLFASVPKRWEIRVPIRKTRFAIERGFVRFYSRQQLDALIASSGVDPERVSVIDLGRDWIVVLRLTR
jgi:2-polyprenyl-3-methyl-5-hydroxy-6-metoxy-1,4-benzoquinol methylase